VICEEIGVKELSFEVDPKRRELKQEHKQIFVNTRFKKRNRLDAGDTVIFSLSINRESVFGACFVFRDFVNCYHGLVINIAESLEKKVTKHEFMRTDR
jgi:hypothetical protein